MDDDTFDALARALTGGSSRRGVLASLTSALLAALPVASGADVAANRKRKRKRKKRKRKKKRRNQVSSPPPPPPPPPPCVGNCTGRQCGDDGCGVSCGACSGAAVCEDGQCQCPAANQCGAVCCAAEPFCSGGYCTCSSFSTDFCSCPPADTLCNNAACCLAQDACLEPVDCFDGQVCACSTETCAAGNDVCQREFAFCGSGAPGSCGCFTDAGGSSLCATMPAGHFCPQSSECDGDDACDDGELCADIGCCNPGEPFVGRCVTLCPFV